MELKEWAQKGQMVSVLDKEVFVIDEGKSQHALVILHGYGTSSIDYHKVLPLLSKKYRVIIQDFIGFGFSHKPYEYYFNILEQADISLELWRILGLTNVTLLSHNYGNQVAIEILTRQRTQDNFVNFQNLIFLNSTLSTDQKNSSKENLEPLERFSRKTRLMSTSFSFYKMKMKEFFYNKDKISDDEIKAKWMLLHHNNGHEVIDFLYDYNTESKLLWKRWFSYLKKNKIPSKVICGKNDDIFNEEEAILLHEELSESEFYLLKDCGHYPMLEQPEKLVELIINS